LGDPHQPEDPVLEIVNWSNAIRKHEVTQHRLFTAVRWDCDGLIG